MYFYLICKQSCPPTTVIQGQYCKSNCDVNNFLYGQLCVATCPTFTYKSPSELKCLLCNSVCRSCNGPLVSQCYSCIENYLLNGNTCTQTCPDLYDYEDQKCISTCGTKYELTDFKSCVTTCPTGYLKCIKKCLITPPDGYYSNGDSCINAIVNVANAHPKMYVKHVVKTAIQLCKPVQILVLINLFIWIQQRRLALLNIHPNFIIKNPMIKEVALRIVLQAINLMINVQVLVLKECILRINSERIALRHAKNVLQQLIVLHVFKIIFWKMDCVN
ncbi:unnamed protein product (macronuclear) [Paramecium tetraurelia]|uniref:Furin-like cysteine-rich domain-containing protein n=1 Tax=Paramecium tetraurelia TaxID=5888 RepID=A0CC96_PARTE|nr:uncharacterized protein GSPATT00037197001 [Paramecium tetraurelia]CAK68413.1 unnamed protein product [Paramecium tetraurelia]|eukprot:XP_001435810.1 hypothetical protein (macronuclear) [Paramecium tetraurelia strain d4-2]